MSAQKLPDPPLGALRVSPCGAEGTQRFPLMLENDMFHNVLRNANIDGTRDQKF